MKKRRLGAAEIDVIAFPKCIGSAVVKESPATVALLSHDIGVGSIGVRALGEKASVDLMLAAIVEDEIAQSVFADQPRAREREIGPQFGEVEQDIVGSAAGALGLAANVGELLALREDIDELDLIDDPVAARKNTAPSRRMFRFHGESA